MIEDRPLWFDQLRPSIEPQRLADFSPLQPGEDMLDIGCGNGFITLLLAWKYPDHGTLVGIDLQYERIVEASHWKEQFHKQWGKILNDVFFFVWNAARSPFFNKQFDLIVSNPPFFPHASHRPAQSQTQRWARRDDQLTLKDLFQCVNNLLKPTGRFHLVFPKKRFQEAAALKEDFFFEITYIVDHPSIRRREGGIQLLQFQKSNSP